MLKNTSEEIKREIVKLTINAGKEELYPGSGKRP